MFLRVALRLVEPIARLSIVCLMVLSGRCFRLVMS